MKIYKQPSKMDKLREILLLKKTLGMSKEEFWKEYASYRRKKGYPPWQSGGPPETIGEFASR